MTHVTKSIRERILALSPITRLYFFVILPTLILIGFMGVVAIVASFGSIVEQAVRPEDIFRYNSTVYVPDQSPLCPAETLVYHPMVEVYRDVVVKRVRTVWSITESRTIISEANPPLFVWQAGDRIAGVTELNLSQYPPLPEGDYEIRVVVYTDYGGLFPPQRYTVPFSVKPESECIP
jgi:hypothetical protein